MHHWDRDTSGKLHRISTPLEQGCEVSVHSENMDPVPEEQQSQQGTPVNPTAYRSMRDHIHPPRVSAPSCIIPPAEDVAVRPYLVPLLPTFHGMENENPYTHIRDFEEVCITFKEGMIDMDLLKLKAFPLTSLLNFEDKVHRKGLARVESLPLLMPRLLSQVLEHLGFPEEPRIERRIRCPQVLSMERAMVMPISFLLQQQDQEKVPDEEAEDSLRRDVHAPEVEMERSPVPDISPPSPPPPASATAPADTPGPSYIAQHSPEYVHVGTRELTGVMDAVCSLAST